MTNSDLLPRGHVLLADDDVMVREGLAELLRRLGFSCVAVASGDEALAQLQATEFDALISDIHMPGNVSLELIESLPQVADGMPVVLLTGRPTVETAARSVRLALAAYLVKPPKMDELSAILDQRIADYRGFRAMRRGRERLNSWEQELTQIEQVLRLSPSSRPGGPMGSYLRLMLRQVILILADVERATVALEQPGAASAKLGHVDHVVALRRTVEVLERTKQNFKSKDLADLRKQLEQLLNRPEA